MKTWLASLFAAAGLRVADAVNVSENLGEAERRGVRSHGLLLVPVYLSRIAAGGINVVSEPQIVTSSGNAATIDAKGGVGQSAAFLGAHVAAGFAREHGIGLVN